MGSIPAKRHQQSRDGATSCSEIRHQQTWQPLLCYRRAVSPKLEIPGDTQERSSPVYALQYQTWTSRHQQIRQLDRVPELPCQIGQQQIHRPAIKVWLQEGVVFSPENYQGLEQTTFRHCVSRVAFYRLVTIVIRLTILSLLGVRTDNFEKGLYKYLTVVV